MEHSEEKPHSQPDRFESMMELSFRVTKLEKEVSSLLTAFTIVVFVGAYFAFQYGKKYIPGVMAE